MQHTIQRTEHVIILDGQIICRPCHDRGVKDAFSYACNRARDHRGPHRNGKREWPRRSR